MTLKRVLAVVSAIGIIILLSPCRCCAEITATEVIKKMDQLIRGKTSISTSKMEITNPNWCRTISMKSWSDGTKKFFIHILEPPREKDLTFLKLDNLLYQYLPSAEMRIKITPSMMLQPWMGSDFTNDDLVKESSAVDDYTHEMLGREKIGEYDCHKIRLTPKPQAPIVWDSILIWVDMEGYFPLREEFFDERGEKVRLMSFSDFRKLPDRQFPFVWTLVPLNKKGHKTVMRYSSIDFNTKIDPHIFTVKNLEKPR